MTDVLHTIIITPLQFILKWVYSYTGSIVNHNAGLSIIGVSIAVSLLCLPLYMMAEACQEKGRVLQEKLQPGIKRIKKAFKGDEQYMMLRTYYLEHHYNPVTALQSSLTLFIQIPFFIAAYHFLSHLELLKGAEFIWIRDLSKPDKLIALSEGFKINALPVIMTAINCVSGLLYTQNLTIKERIRTLIIPFIFLALLYNSPSGLVLYWTMNNIFSLVKNIFYKLKHPRIVIDFFSCIGGTFVFLYLLFSKQFVTTKLFAYGIIFLILSFIPFLQTICKNKLHDGRFISFPSVSSSDTIFFVLGGIFLVLLTGVLIPVSVIASSPSEFIDPSAYRNPLHFVLHSTLIAAGMFLLWPSVMFAVAKTRIKKIFALVFFCIAIIALIHFFCFGRNIGLLSANLKFGDTPQYKRWEQILSTLSLVIIPMICTVLFLRCRQVAFLIYACLITAVAGLSVMHISTICKELQPMRLLTESDQGSVSDSIITLDKRGKNVVLIMLDRASAVFFPYIIEEKPNLQTQYSGFTFYPNTISFAGHTSLASPALFGGYEYTPLEINLRSTELLKDKHNEALKLLPVLFGQHGYKVSVCDLPYANYQWVPDLSIFNQYDYVETHLAEGRYSHGLNKYLLEQNNWNFFCYSLFKTAPVMLQTTVYNGGKYRNPDPPLYGSAFINAYTVLKAFPEVTRITDTGQNNFFAIDNNTAHEPELLQKPDYTPEEHLDNSGYSEQPWNLPTIKAYHANMASLLLLGKWFDFLKQNDVYDNTRIIIVADHGQYTGQFDSAMLPREEFGSTVQPKHDHVETTFYNPLLLYKDFDSKEFKTSNEFMTNADTPLLAIQGIVSNPINPFTGKPISNDEKNAHPQLVTTSYHWELNYSNPYTYDISDGKILSVHDDIQNHANWKLVLQQP